MTHFLTIVTALALLGLTACASTQKWSSAGGDREEGVVRLAYEYPESREAKLSEAQASKLALSRCNAWGYRKAEPIPGQVRRCTNTDDGNCDLWRVTREFQCSNGQGGYAGLSR